MPKSTQCYALAERQFATACQHWRWKSVYIDTAGSPAPIRGRTIDWSTRTAGRAGVARHGVRPQLFPEFFTPLPPGSKALHRCYSYTLLINRLCNLLVTHTIIWNVLSSAQDTQRTRTQVPRRVRFNTTVYSATSTQFQYINLRKHFEEDK